jgi:hypothetical protein
LCFLIGVTIPAIGAEQEARNRRAENRGKMQGTLATESDAIRDEVAALNAQHGNPAQKQAAAAPRKDPGSDIGPGLAVVLFLFSPVFAMMQFGMTASAMGVMALGYALYQAWKQTDGQGMVLDLSGPFRVGKGPIPAR